MSPACRGAAMFEWLEYEFMLRALAATSVLSFSIAPVGAFLVLRRLSLAGEAMAHAIVPGIVITIPGTICLLYTSPSPRDS